MSSHFAELAQPMILKMEQVACNFLKEKSISFNNFITSDLHQMQKKFWFVCSCNFFPNFCTDWISVETIAVTRH